MTQELSSLPVTQPKSYFSFLKWGVLSFFLILFFTVLKLPKNRFQGYVDDVVFSLFQQQGIEIIAQQTQFSFWGPSYTLKDVTFRFTTPRPALHFEQVDFSTSFIRLLFGKIHTVFQIQHREGILQGTLSLHQSQISFSFNAKKLNLAQWGIFSALTQLHGTALLNGRGSISGDWNLPESLHGGLFLQINQLQIEPQMIAGFSVPRIEISEVNLDVPIQDKKILFKKAQFGNTSKSTDDFKGTILGHIGLAKNWASCPLQLQIHFSLSENVLKSFALLGALLGSGRQTDGSYDFQLTGSLLAPIPGNGNK